MRGLTPVPGSLLARARRGCWFRLDPLGGRAPTTVTPRSADSAHLLTIDRSAESADLGALPARRC
jgi:hypothetical protein